jgi:hypothetical protein
MIMGQSSLDVSRDVSELMHVEDIGEELTFLTRTVERQNRVQVRPQHSQVFCLASDRSRYSI